MIRNHPARCNRRRGQRGRRVPGSIIPLVLILAIVAGSGLAPAAATAAPVDATDQYDLDVTFDPDARTLTGSMSVTWVNDTGQPQDALHFRLYPNASYYEEGETVVSAVTVDGDETVSEVSSLDPTVLEVGLGQAVNPGEGATVALRFETIVPDMPEGSFSVLSGNASDGWWLADWYPILAGRDETDDVYLAPPTPFGDPTFAESATYRLALTAPAGFRVLGSGVTSDRVVDSLTGQVTTTIETGLGRDLTLSLLPDRPGNEPITVTATVAEIAVRVSLPPRLAIPGLGRAILDIARDALPVYEAWLGDYHEPELDIVPFPMAGTGGVSWHGIVWLDLEAIAADGSVSAEEETGLRFVLTHELGHQWIVGIIGSNNNDHGFMSEGLTNILAVLVIREADGPEVAEDYLRDWIASGYREMVVRGVDGVADAPVRASTDIVSRARLVYGKAALGFESIRQEIGDQDFFAALATYAKDYRFAVSSPDDLRRAFEQASGTDLEPLWSFWFEERATTIADIDALLDGFAPN